MPRNRNNRNGSLIVLDESTMDIDIPEPIRPVKDYLKNQFWELKKSKEESMECSICLSEIDCKNCFSLLSCGHSFHLCCIFKCSNCPLCRG